MWTNILIILVTFSCFKAEPCLVTEFDQISSFTLNCKNITIENLTVPGGETLKLNLTDGATVIFKGKTVFEFYLWKGPLVTINGTAVTVEGDEGHVFDGRGEEYWDGLGDWGVTKPQFFTVQTFGGSILRNIYVVNSPHDVLQVTNSDSVTYSNWYINNTAGDEGVAPEGKFAKNTDAFDVWNSTNVIIEDSVVYNQDDCIAVRCGANINVNNLECHGTHGLSISVGFNNDTTAINPLNVLTNVTFANSTLFGGENAIHIKTHNEGGYGFIENVTYENIQLKGPSRYGILIEENYPNHGEPSDNIPIRNLLISNVKGEVEPEAVAVSVVCAENGCENWFWSGIEITGSQKNSTCNFQPSGSFIC